MKTSQHDRATFYYVVTSRVCLHRTYYVVILFGILNDINAFDWPYSSKKSNKLKTFLCHYASFYILDCERI